MRAATLGSALSPASAAPARYGSKNGEEHIDRSMSKPLGSALSFHKDGGELDPDKVNVVGETGPEAIVGDSGEVIPLNDDRVPLRDAGSPEKALGFGSAYAAPDAMKILSDQRNAQAADTQDQQHRDLIAEDKKQAATSGDLVDLGKSLINEKIMNKAANPLGSALPDVAPLGSAMPKYAGPSKTDVKSGDLIPNNEFFSDEKAYEKLPETRDAAKVDLWQKRKALDQQLLSPDLSVVGNARRQLAELEKQTPYGSFSNHPGLLGKIEHGLAKAGNIAGDIFAPGTMEFISVPIYTGWRNRTGANLSRS